MSCNRVGLFDVFWPTQEDEEGRSHDGCLRLPLMNNMAVGPFRHRPSILSFHCSVMAGSAMLDDSPDPEGSQNSGLEFRFRTEL